jgi:Hemerythrin HHE cation binding domain
MKIQFQIDPTSPEYQIGNEFSPDKEKSWPFAPEMDGWVLAHNGLRGEMELMREALESIAKRGQQMHPREIKAIKDALKVHLKHIHIHHSIEDDIFTPEYKKRFRYPDKVTFDWFALCSLEVSVLSSRMFRRGVRS